MPKPHYDVTKTFTVNLSDPMDAEHPGRPGHRHDSQSQYPTPDRDRQCGGDRQCRRHDRRDLHRQPVGALGPAGERGLLDDRLQPRSGSAGGRRLRARPRGTLTFDPGQTEQTITVTVNPEPADALDKYFAVVLSQPSGAAISTAGVGAGTILMPGTVPSVSIGDASVIASPTATTDRDLHRQPLGRLAPAGDRALCHGRRQRHGGPRLCRHPADSPDLHPGPDRADHHGHGQCRADRLSRQDLQRRSLDTPAGAHDFQGRGHRLDPRARHPAGRLDRFRRPWSPLRRPDRSDFRRQPVGTPRPAGERGTTPRPTAPPRPASTTSPPRGCSPSPRASPCSRRSRSRSMPAPQYNVAKTFTVDLSDPMGATIDAAQATGTIENPNAAAPGLDRRRHGDRQPRRPDRRDLHRHPDGALRPAGERRLPDVRRQCHRRASTTSPFP